MTTLSSSGPHRRTLLLRVAGMTWLLLISVGTLIDHMTLVGLAEQTRARAPSTQVAALGSQLTELDQHLDALRRQPAALPQARFDAEQQALQQRLAAIEQALAERLDAKSRSPLQVRIEQLEARVAKISQPPATPVRKRTNPPIKPKSAALPFDVIGLELRGGERFVSLLPTGAAASSPTHVLRPGEAESGWQLDAIEGHIAVFHRGGQVRRVVTP